MKIEILSAVSRPSCWRSPLFGPRRDRPSGSAPVLSSSVRRNPIERTELFIEIGILGENGYWERRKRRLTLSLSRSDGCLAAHRMTELLITSFILRIAHAIARIIIILQFIKSCAVNALRTLFKSRVPVWEKYPVAIERPQRWLARYLYGNRLGIPLADVHRCCGG